MFLDFKECSRSTSCCNNAYKMKYFFYTITQICHLSWATVITNKKPMGHIPHPRNQFKSKHICSKLWLYHPVDLERRKPIISFFFIIEWSLFVKHWVPFTQGCYRPSLVEIDQMVLQKIFRFRQCIFAIS